MISRFSRFIAHHRQGFNWSISELARRSELTAPEISRLEAGVRTPTLRHVKGIAQAFSSVNGETSYNEWVGQLVDLGEAARKDARKADRLGSTRKEDVG